MAGDLELGVSSPPTRGDGVARVGFVAHGEFANERGVCAGEGDDCTFDRAAHGGVANGAGEGLGGSERGAEDERERQADDERGF